MITIDTKAGLVIIRAEDGTENSHPIGTPEAFEIISEAWLRSGWDTKQVYSFTWLGRPIIQLPEDMVRLQEVIYSIQPDVIIETGVAHGGSLIYYASLCQLMGVGRIVGIDIEIRPHNRKAIEAHALSSYITLIEGSSIDPDTVAKVKTEAAGAKKVLIFLDSCHTKQHVLDELRAYAPLVSKGSYIVAMDGIMEAVTGAPRTQPDWTWNNPTAAALEFVAENSDFIIEEPKFAFNEGTLRKWVTYWPGGFLKKIA